jgi:hypothetical protein
VGIGGDVVDHTRNDIAKIVLEQDRFAQRFGRIAKQPDSQFFCQYNGFGLAESRAGVAIQKRVREHLKHALIGKQNIVHLDFSIAVVHGSTAFWQNPHGQFHFRIVFFEGWRKWGRGRSHVHVARFPLSLMHHPHNPGGSLMEPVVAQFVGHIERNEQAGCQPYGQPEEVDTTVNPVFPKTAESDFEVVAKHENWGQKGWGIPLTLNCLAKAVPEDFTIGYQ